MMSFFLALVRPNREEGGQPWIVDTYDRERVWQASFYCENEESAWALAGHIERGAELEAQACRRPWEENRVPN